MNLKMKLIPTLIATLTLSACMASPSYAALDCKDIHESATVVMTYRQYDLSYPDLMELAGDKLTLQTLAQAAYEQSAYSSDTYQQKAIKSFANDWYKACLNHNAGK